MNEDENKVMMDDEQGAAIQQPEGDAGISTTKSETGLSNGQKTAGIVTLILAVIGLFGLLFQGGKKIVDKVKEWKANRAAKKAAEPVVEQEASNVTVIENDEMDKIQK